MAAPIGFSDAVSIAVKVYELYQFFGKDAPEAIALAGQTAHEVAALLGQYENPAALPPFLQQEAGQKLAKVVKGQVKRIRKTLKELKLHLAHGKAVRPKWYKWCIFLSFHVGTIKELQQELQRLKENITINLQTATFPGDAKVIKLVEEQAQLINKIFDDLQSIRKAQENARADEKHIKRTLQSVDFSKYQTNTIEPGTRKRVINELTDSGLSNQEAEKMLTTCSREASRLSAPPAKPPKSAPKATGPVPEIKTIAPKQSNQGDAKKPKVPPSSAKNPSPKPSPTKPKTADRSLSPSPNNQKPKAADLPSRPKSPQPSAKSPSPKPTQGKLAPPSPSPSPGNKSSQSDTKGRSPLPAPKSPKLAPSDAGSVAGSSSSSSSANKSTSGKKQVKTPRKPTILFVDQSNGVRSSMAQLYLELVRTWSANSEQDWLFHRVDSAGLMIHSRFRAEEGRLSDDERLVPADAPLSPETARLLLSASDFDSPGLREKEHIVSRILAQKRQGLRPSFADFDYIVCFEQKDSENLQRLLAAARQQQQQTRKKTQSFLSSHQGPKIIQLTGCPYKTSDDLGKYAALLRADLKNFLETQLGWTRPAGAFAAGRLRTAFVRLGHVAQKDLVLGDKNAELLSLQRETDCGMRVFFASREYGWVLAVTGRRQLLAAARRRVADVIGDDEEEEQG